MSQVTNKEDQSDNPRWDRVEALASTIYTGLVDIDDLEDDRLLVLGFLEAEIFKIQNEANKELGQALVDVINERLTGHEDAVELSGETRTVLQDLRFLIRYLTKG